MKNRLFGIAVTLMALLSSCETIVEQKVSIEVLPTEEKTVFTANLGVDTKTYLEYQDDVYKTLWEADDNIFVLATSSSDSTWWYDTANLIEGAGTSTATFAAGANVRGDKYYAFYGPSYYTYEGVFYPVLQEYQYMRTRYDEAAGEYVADNNLDGYYFPMYAESNTTTFAFKNLCSILKVDIVGTDYIDNVVFTPNDPTIPVAGKANLTFVEGEPVMSLSDSEEVSHKVCFYVRETLNETEPISCYISIPPQTYNGGFTLTINSNLGSMQVNVTEDVTFTRSQIRSTSLITYQNQNSVTWGLVGDMTNWENDIVMTPVESIYVIEEVYLEADIPFKFRANGMWEVNLGAAAGYEAVESNVAIQLTNDGANMYVTETGYYTVSLDVARQRALFEKIEPEEPEYVECSSFDEVAALPDDTMVLVSGFVFVPYGRGFIMNIGSYWDNCILVYQGTDQSNYYPVMGNTVSIIARKTTYNKLPELIDVQMVQVIDDGVRDFGYNTYYNLYDPETFRTINLDRYVYVKYAGTLQKSGSYYNVIVDGVEERMGSIEFPVQDLTEFIDKRVSVEGWFIGFASGGKYLKTVIRSITLIDDNASTEDVTPGDDIVIVTKSAKKFR